MKVKTRWICQECGFQTSRSLGRCTECGSWNSFVEEMDSASIKTAAQPLIARNLLGHEDASGPVCLDEVELERNLRVSTGVEQLDAVLGGGVVPGSVILLAGDPGIGKSTLLLQVAQNLAVSGRLLYVSGEESKQQVSMRGRRLGVSSKNVLIDSEQSVLSIREAMVKAEASFAVIDSIQTIYHPEISSAPGSVSQVREGAGLLIAHAKSCNLAMIIVGHVTKDGSIAGPRVLEHLVDVVLQFEGDQARQFRILRAVKNRFGSTQEVAIFSMSENGLQEVLNPSAAFLGTRLEKSAFERAASGTAVIASAEGSRAYLLEVQALVADSALGSPRRVANGYDYARLLQILAVLERRAGIFLSREDVYVNIVGGFQCNDPAGDLGVAIAAATSALDRSVDPFMIAIGEIGLSGEIRAVAALDRRLKEAQNMGFKSALIPKSNLSAETSFGKLKLLPVESLTDALNHVMPGFNMKKQKKAEQESLVT